MFLCFYHYRKKLKAKQLNNDLDSCENDPIRMLIQGSPGVGKTTFLQYITYQWAIRVKAREDSGKHVVFYLSPNQMNHLNLDIHGTIINMWMPNSGVTHDALNEITKEYKVTFIIDDFNLLSHGVIFQLKETMFTSNANIITSVQSQIGSNFMNLFKTKYSILGLNPGNQRKIIQHYKCLTNSWQEGFSVLTAELQNKTSPVYKLSLNAFNLIALCAILEGNLSMDRLDTRAQLLDEWFNSLQIIYKKRMERNHCKSETEQSINRAILKAEIAAIDCAKFHTNIPGSCDSLNNVYLLLEQLGILINSYGKYKFSSQVIIHYLAAKGFISMPCVNKQQLSTLVHDSKLRDLCTLVCGLCHNGNNYSLMSELFHKLSTRNKEKVTLQGNKYQQHGGPRYVNSEDILTSLDALVECENRRDMCRLVSFNIPEKVQINMKQNLENQHYMEGIAAILELEVAHISAVALNLDHCSSYHDNECMFLSEAISNSKFLNSLTIHWYSLEMLANILLEVFHSNRLIKHAELVSKCEKPVNTSDKVIAKYRNACSGMTSVSSFTMTDYQDLNLVNITVRALPTNILKLSTINCVSNVVTAEEIKIKVKRCDQLQKLDMTSMKIADSNIAIILKAVKFSQSLKELNLKNTKMGIKSFISLADTIKASTCLVIIDISENPTSYEACFHLSTALEHNETIQELIMIDCGLSVESQKLFEYLQRPSLLLLGPKHVRQYGKPMFRPMIDVNRSPVLM